MTAVAQLLVRDEQQWQAEWPLSWMRERLRAQRQHRASRGEASRLRQVIWFVLLIC
jgi:hypothetical protein